MRSWRRRLSAGPDLAALFTAVGQGPVRLKASVGILPSSPGQLRPATAGAEAVDREGQAHPTSEAESGLLRCCLRGPSAKSAAHPYGSGFLFDRALTRRLDGEAASRRLPYVRWRISVTAHHIGESGSQPMSSLLQNHSLQPKDDPKPSPAHSDTVQEFKA